MLVMWLMKTLLGSANLAMKKLREIPKHMAKHKTDNKLQIKLIISNKEKIPWNWNIGCYWRIISEKYNIFPYNFFKYLC